MKTELSRLSADIPKQYHKKIKSIALLSGKTIREVLMEAIDSIDIECVTSDHIPNAETRRVVEEIERGKNLIKGKEAEKVTKKLGL